MSFHLHSMFVYKVRTCSRLGVRMVCCITAWTLCQRFLGNRKWATRQITSSNPSILSPRPSTCRRYTCTRRRWTAQVSLLHASVCCVLCVPEADRSVSLFSSQVSGRATLTLMPTHFISRRKETLTVSSAQNNSEPRWWCLPSETLWPVHTVCMGWGITHHI